MQKIAVVGSGISGMAAATLLSQQYDVTLYEKNDYAGGHARTRTIVHGEKSIDVDTGFIVYNNVNYPELIGLFKHYGVATHASNMSFALSSDNGAFEWGAKNINAVFGQRSNLLKPAFYAMIADVAKFFKHAPKVFNKHDDLSLGQLLALLGVGKRFREQFILPIGAAIWSCPVERMVDFPARTFVQFFENHGLLSFTGQHQWYTVTGGSKQYVSKLLSAFKGKILLNSPVEKLWRVGEFWHVQTQEGIAEVYDHVVMAAHADEALEMVVDANDLEMQILGAFKFQQNQIYLHSDASHMPKRKACWASWNYLTDTSADINKLSLTYWMNSLQKIDDNYPIFLTLNPLKSVAPDKVFEQHQFAHPIFTAEAIRAQAQIPAIQGKRNIWFCGAYQRYGFHEDGLMSAVSVAKSLGVNVPWH